MVFGKDAKLQLFIGIPEDKFVLVVEFYASLISQFSEKSSVSTQIWVSDHFLSDT